MSDIVINVEEIKARSELVLDSEITVTPGKMQQKIYPSPDAVGIEKLTCGAVPAGYIKPEGAKESLNNGENVVSEYKTATVTRDKGLFYVTCSTYGGALCGTEAVKILRKIPYGTESSVTLPVCERVLSRSFYKYGGNQVTLTACKIVDPLAFEKAATTDLYLPIVQKIGAEAFKNSGLKYLTMYKVARVPSLGTDAFAGCADLVRISVPKSLADAFKADPSWGKYADKINGLS